MTRSALARTTRAGRSKLGRTVAASSRRSRCEAIPRSTRTVSRRISRRSRRAVLERIAGDEHDPADEGWPVAGEEVDERPAGVLADQRDVLQLQSVKEL